MALLTAIGFPPLGTELIQRRRARVLLAVCNLRPSTPWAQAAVMEDGRDHALSQKGVLRFINKHYGESISEGSYDDIKRKHLRHLEAAKLVIAAANRPNSPVNDGTRGYALNPHAARLVHSMGTADFDAAAAKFKERFGTLRAMYKRERNMKMVPVTLPDGLPALLADTPHNALQIAIIKEFLSRFAIGADVIYLGDSDKKKLTKKEEVLKSINFYTIGHDTMPDVLAYDPVKNWLFLVEAVNSANPISLHRHVKYEEMLEKCTAEVVFVSVFKDRRAFAKYAADISWETEVWLADEYTHLIHYNGDRFMGPHPRRRKSTS